MSEVQGVEYERTSEEKLRSLIRRDINPEITRLAENALESLQEGESP